MIRDKIKKALSLLLGRKIYFLGGDVAYRYIYDNPTITHRIDQCLDCSQEGAFCYFTDDFYLYLGFT